MKAGEVLLLMRRVFSDNVLLDVNQIDQLRRLLDAHEELIREHCAKIAEEAIEDHAEAREIAAAIKKGVL